MKFYNNLLMEKFTRNGTEAKLSVYGSPEIVIQPRADTEGLDKACVPTDKSYRHGDSLYVAGTSYWQDLYDDLKIPCHQEGMIRRCSAE